MRKRDVRFCCSAFCMLCALILVGTSAASAPQNDVVNPKPQLNVTWLDPANLFPSGAQRVGQHVKWIFENIDVSTSWRIGSIAISNDPSAFGLRVVLMPSDPTSWGLSDRVMGLVPKKEPREAIYVFYPAILRALGYEGDGVASGPRLETWVRRHWREVSLALSRVVVHEVVHAVLPALDHHPKGLMRSKLNEATLIQYRAAIDPHLAALLRVGLTNPSSTRVVAANTRPN